MTMAIDPAPEGAFPYLGLNLTHGLLEAVGRKILSGAYKSTCFPTEAELASAYGVSRSVAREAVKMLAAKGLLIGRPRQGTSVQASSAWNLFDVDILRWLRTGSVSYGLLQQLNELRKAIEPEAAGLAARNATPSDITRLRKYLENMANSACDHNLMESMSGFHLNVLKISNNIFIGKLQNLSETAIHHEFRLMAHGNTRFHLNYYEAVISAISSQDADKARMCMHRLIK